MKTINHVKSKPKRKHHGAIKPGKSALAAAPKKTATAFRGENRPDARRVRLEGLVDDLNKSRATLGATIRRQTDELKIKNGQIRNGADKLHRSDEQLRILTKAIESTTEGVFILDAQKANYPVIYANPSFRTMTGYTDREILGREYFLLFGTDADPRVIAEIKHTLQQGDYFHGELLTFNKSGQKYWNHLRLAPVRDAGGAVTHFVGIQADVTLMRQREYEIKEQREELLHVTRVGKLAEFVSSLAHEISQPLTAIISYAHAAQRTLSKREPEIQKILQYIIDDDQRAVEVIRRMRTLLKKGKPEMKPLDINTLINETLDLIATDASVRKCSLDVDLERDLPPVLGDRIQLQQVLLNLFSNSFDAMEEAPGVCDILIRTSRKDKDTLLVAVKDSGGGISAGNMPKLFSHFFTSKPDGLGMGLSISRSIVEAHGGRLEAENNSDHGATFFFTLPIWKREAQ
jgi:PAS domain S-box-containing protein